MPRFASESISVVLGRFAKSRNTIYSSTCSECALYSSILEHVVPFERFPLEHPVAETLTELIVDRVRVCWDQISHEVQIAISSSPEKLHPPRLVPAIFVRGIINCIHHVEQLQAISRHGDVVGCVYAYT